MPENFNPPEQGVRNYKRWLIPVFIFILLVSLGIGSFLFIQSGRTLPKTLRLFPGEGVRPSPSPESKPTKPTLKKGTYLNKEFGVLLSHPENWELVKEDKDIVIWNVKSDSGVVGMVTLRKTQVLGEKTFNIAQQETKTVVEEISGIRQISVSGKAVTEAFVFEKDIEGKPNQVTIELAIPDQDAIGAKTAASLHSEFDGVLRSISIPGEYKTPDPEKSIIALSREKVKADGVDFSTLTVTLRDSEGKIVPNFYINILPEDSSDHAFNQVIPKSPLPSQRTNSAAAVIKDRIIVAGGRNYNDILSMVEIYDPRTDRWSGANNIWSQREELTLDEVGGKLYAIGGNKGVFAEVKDGDWFWDKVEMFDPGPNVYGGSWLPKTSMLRGRKAHASGVVDGKIYILTGMTRNTYPECSGNLGDNVEVYDTETDVWSIANDKIVCVTGAKSVTVGKKIYLFGGRADITPYDGIGNSEILSDVRIYNTETNNWKTGASIPHPRERGGAAVISGKVYLIGGFKSQRGTKPGENYNEFVDVYDPATNTWTTMGKFFPTPIDFSDVSYDDKIYTFGGEHLYSWPYRSAVFEFTPLKTAREPVINPSDERGVVQFKFYSLFAGNRSYKVIAYDPDGSEIEIGEFSVTFE